MMRNIRTPSFAMNRAHRGFRTLRSASFRPAAPCLLRGAPFKPTPRPSLGPVFPLSISGGPGGPVRAYSSDPNPRLSIDEYHRIADHALEYLVESYEELAEDFPEIDVDLAQGVMTLYLPPHGTYVINKQPPNKQIWLSSPLSGPKRYDWVDGKWVYARDNSTLGDLMRQETNLITEPAGREPLELTELK